MKESTGAKSFCLKASFHGWKYIYTEKGTARSCLWVVVVMAAVGGCAFFMLKNLLEFLNSKTLTSIDTTTASLRDVTFPSVLICNVNQVSKTFISRLEMDDNSSVVKNHDAIALLFNEFIDGEQEPIKPAEMVLLEKLKKQLEQKYQWKNTQSFVTLASQNCSEMILYTEWSQTVKHKFYNAFQGITDYGACCLIVPHLDFVNEVTRHMDPSQYTANFFHEIPSGARNGETKGLKVVLDVESYDYAYFPRSAKGFKVAVVDARDKAVIQQDGYYIKPGTETLAAMSATIINASDVALTRFLPEERSCYVDNEFYFKNLLWSNRFRYSIRNCFYEAVIAEIIKDCQCFPPFFKVRNSTIPICTGTKLSCSNQWVDRMALEGEHDMTYAVSNDSRRLRCETRCKLEMQYMAPSYAIFPVWETFLDRMEFCLVLEKLALKVCKDESSKNIFELNNESVTTCEEITDLYFVQRLCYNDENSTMIPNKTLLLPNHERLARYLYNYTLDNVAVLNIFFKDPFYTKMKKDEKISILQFIANAGGLLGLCMGVSFVGLFEVFYHVFNFWFTIAFKSFCMDPIYKKPRKALNQY